MITHNTLQFISEQKSFSFDFFFQSKVDFSLLSVGKAGFIFSLKVPMLVCGLFPFLVRNVSRFFDLATCCDGWREDQRRLKFQTIHFHTL